MTKHFELINEDIIEENQKPEQLLSPGQLLFKEREAKKLSIDTVAQQLLLSKQMVSDIEDDVTSKIYSKVASVYIKGYLRSYAKLLNIPEEQILEAYDNFKQIEKKGENEVVSTYIREEVKDQREKSTKIIKHISRRKVGIVVVAIITLILLVFISRSCSKAAPEINTTTNALPVEKSAQPMSNLIQDQGARTN